MFAPLLLGLLSAFASATTSDELYIAYDGEIRGSYILSDPALSKCGENGTYYFDKLNETALRIGPRPLDDEVQNPFYFRISHKGHTNYQAKSSNIEKRKRICFGGMCTLDAIYNMYLSSVYDDGYTEYSDLIDINKSSISVVDGGSDFDGSPYYHWTGDIKPSDFRKAREDAGFNFQIPQNYSDSDAEDNSPCKPPVFYWEYAGRVTCTLNFTNSSSTAMLTYTTNGSYPHPITVTMLFTGVRRDVPKNGTNQDYFVASSAPMALEDPKKNAVPHFTFGNGTELPKPEDTPSPNSTSSGDSDSAAGNIMPGSSLVVHFMMLLVLVALYY